MNFLKRQTLFNIHFYLSAFFTPFLFLMAFTGAGYLFNNKGSVQSTVVKEGVVLEMTSSKEEAVAQVLKEIDPGYSFEYVREAGPNMMTRPTTKDYYSFKKQGDGTYAVSKESPDFMYRIVEVHKGHGSSLMKWFEKFLGLSLMLIILSGLLMSLKMKPRVKSFLATAGAGLVLWLVLFLM